MSGPDISLFQLVSISSEFAGVGCWDSNSSVTPVMTEGVMPTSTVHGRTGDPEAGARLKLVAQARALTTTHQSAL